MVRQLLPMVVHRLLKLLDVMVLLKELATVLLVTESHAAVFIGQGIK